MGSIGTILGYVPLICFYRSSLVELSYVNGVSRRTGTYTRLRPILCFNIVLIIYI